MLFAVDDSEIVIESRLHTILAGVGFERPDETKAQIRAIKAQFGLRSHEEIKWNGTRLESQQQREAMSEELLGVLSHLKFVVTVSEGTDRQVALEYLTIQVDDFLQYRSTYSAEPAALRLTCDNGIIQNSSAYEKFLKGTKRPRLAVLDFESVTSDSDELVQCADICAGFSRLLIDLALDRPNRRLILLEKFDDSSPNAVDLDLRHLVLFSLRYSMWGEVPPPRDVNNIQFDGTYPFLHTAGKGLRIHSTVREEVISKIYQDAGVVYFGCLH